MDLSIVARKFAGYVARRKNVFDIDDIVLYGSLAEGVANPGDVDIMLVHHNPVFEKIQQLRGEDGCSNDFQRVALVEEGLLSAGYPSIAGLLETPELLEAISLGVLNVVYLHRSFFTDLRYRVKAIRANENPRFYYNVFTGGLLWNSESQEFELPASQRYSLLDQALGV